MSLRYLLSLLIILTGVFCQAQPHINWVSIDQAQQLSKTAPKKILIDIYTDWCGWCKVMDRQTFTDPDVVRMINEHFYAVKFNAEQKAEVEFKNEVYRHVNTGFNGYHELAKELSRGNLSYPTLIFLDEDLNVIQPLRGFQEPDKLEMISLYFADDYYKTMPWDIFVRNYPRLQAKEPK